MTDIKNYALGKNIGKGAYGSVAIALNMINAERVAIKRIHTEERFMISALKEIKILTELNTYNMDDYPIVELVDYFIDNKIQYLVFEYLDINLYKYYLDNILSFKLVKSIFKDLAKGLFYIHSLDIIHCDLKPENIMINLQTKQIKIIDFGSSKYTGDKQNNFYIQSRYYRAPEIVFELKYDSSIDVWSIGCIIYELLFRRPLFPCKNMNNLVYQLTGLLGIPEGNNYLISPKFESYFKWDILNNKYVRKMHSKNNYLPVNTYGLNSKLNYKLHRYLLPEDKYNLMILLESILKYDYQSRITASEILKNELFQEK